MITITLIFLMVVSVLLTWQVAALRRKVEDLDGALDIQWAQFSSFLSSPMETHDD